MIHFLIIALAILSVQHTAETTILCAEYRHPILTNRFGFLVTNYVGGGQSYGQIQITWKSSPGKAYAVESSHALGPRQGPSYVYTGDDWVPVSLPVVASNNVASWRGGIQSESRMFRVVEID